MKMVHDASPDVWESLTGGGKLRYDYAAEASELLRQYVDADPGLCDTHDLAARAAKACLDLENIEFAFEQVSTRKTPKRKPIPTAMNEWRKKHNRFFEQNRQFLALCDTLKPFFFELQRLIALSESIELRLTKISEGLLQSVREEPKPKGPPLNTRSPERLAELREIKKAKQLKTKKEGKK